MADDNQNPVTPEPKGSDFLKDDNPKDKQDPSFTKDDIEKILKQNTNAQSFIEQLKSETSEMREQIKVLQEELSKARTIDDLFDKYGQHDSGPGPNTPPVNKQELLAELKADIFKEMSASEQKAKEEANWEESKRQAAERHGEKWDTYVDQRAKDLGISIQDMRTYARTSPKVFMELLGGQSQQKSSSPTQGSQRFAPQSGETVQDRYRRYIRIRHMNTEEGRQAREMLNNPVFMEEYRLAILKNVGV